jgi:TonB family protein
MNGPLRLRIEPGNANESWKRSEGRIVAEKFQLLRYLAGSDVSGVFLTSIQISQGESKEAAIKLIYAGATDADKQLLLWTSARELSHPNLIHVFEAGRSEIDGMQLLYVVEEYAEENLSQVLPERALTPEEVREMLPPILGALQYLHGKGFAHGHVQPSNVLAIGDQVKLSSDTLVPLGEKCLSAATSTYDPPEAKAAVSAASDVWQLGMTLTEVLTQHLPSWDRTRPGSLEIPRSLPEPFREVTKHCLQVDAAKRWTIAEILSSLDSKSRGVGRLESPQSALALVSSEKTQIEKAISGPVVLGLQKTSVKWPYFLLVAAVVVGALFLIARPKSSEQKSSSPLAEAQSTQSQNSVTAEKSQAVNSLSTPISTQSGPAAVDEKASASLSTSDESGVVKRVMPEVSPSARRTIHGTIAVRVKVKVDAAGNVQEAKIESGRGSRYFSRIALDAARDWKFSPAQAGEAGERAWKVQFRFSRTKTEASAARAKS